MSAAASGGRCRLTQEKLEEYKCASPVLPCKAICPDGTVCGEPYSKHISAAAAAASPALDDSTSSEDSFADTAMACVNLIRPNYPAPLNGTLARINRKYYVLSSAHLMAKRPKADQSAVEVYVNTELQLRTDSLEGDVQWVSLPWLRCRMWAQIYFQAKDTASRVMHDVCVFELAPLSSDPDLEQVVAAHAFELFDWSPKNPAKSKEPHIPSSKAVGASLMQDPFDPYEPITIKMVDTRFDQWKRNRGFTYLAAGSWSGQSGTGLTDKKKRLIAVLSGNYDVKGKDVAVAVLATRHQALLASNDCQEFTPAATPLVIDIAPPPPRPRVQQPTTQHAAATSTSSSSSTAIPDAQPHQEAGDSEPALKKQKI